MIEGQEIICFCNDWDGDPLSKKQIVTRLAARNRILWINSTGNRNPRASVHDLRRAAKKVWAFCQGCRAVAPNISVFSPLVIPFHGNRWARWLNRRFYAWSLRRTMRRLKFGEPVVLSFVPSSADVVSTLGARRTIYYCVDEYSRFTGTDREAVLEMERRLMEKSDVVIVSAGPLYESKKAYHPNTFLITHGVDVEHFRKACLAETAVPEDFPPRRGPVIGFFGLIEDWVDLGVIGAMAEARPEWTFVLIGEVRAETAAVRERPNVHLLGRRSYQALPGYCKMFDVAILPFVVNELTIAANPLKLREYLAAGLPVVATPLPEVKRLEGLVRLARTAEEYIAEIEGLLAAGRRGPRLADSHRMDQESWDDKVDELSGYLDGRIAPARERVSAA